MLIACIQTNPQENMAENIETTFSLVKQAAQNGARVVVLPEMFTYMGQESERKKTQHTLDQGVFSDLKNLAKQLHIVLIGGSHAETPTHQSEKVFNTCATFDQNGENLSVYRKLHLFNLKDPLGNPIYCESNSFEQGEKPVPYVIKDPDTQQDWQALNIICYDTRFPEIIRNSKQKIDVLFVPAAFTWQTGQAHWQVLLRARAIENQCFVVACNQTGFYGKDKKRNYGHSMVIDPWGQVLAQQGEECGFLSCKLDKNLITQSRAKLPALDDRKL